MPRLCVYLLIALICAPTFLLPRSGWGQVQPRARYEGHLLPVVAYNRGTGVYTVVQDGRKRESRSSELDIQPAKEFGPGFVAVSEVVADLDPLKDATPQQRAKPASVRFRWEAELTAETDLKDCFGVLTIVVNGSVGILPVPLGRLPAGRARRVEIELTYRVDAVGRLHVFSETKEVRNSQVLDPYDVRAYYETLLAGWRGISAVELCQRQVRYPYSLSDDGDRLATTRERENHNSLIVYDLAAMKLLHDIKIGETGENAWDLTWISDHELLYISNDPRPHRYFSNLMKLDLNTGVAEKLRERVDRILARPRNQPDVVVLLRHRGWDLSSIKYDFRQRRPVGSNEFQEGVTLVDDDGEERVRWVGSGDTYEYFFKPNPKSGWRSIDKHVKQPGLKFDYRARDALENLCELHSIGPDGDTLYLSTRADSDRFKLAAFSMSRGEIVKVVAEHPLYDLRTGAEGYASLHFRKGTSELIGITYDAEKLRTVWLDPGFAAVQKMMDSNFPEHVNRPIDWSASGNTFVYFSFSDRDPGTYYVLRPLESQLIPVQILGESLKEKKLAETKPWKFQSRDGATIHAYVTRPPEPAAELPPLVVDIHGGPMARDSWGFSEQNQFLATRGYVVLQVNYRGSSGYGAAYQKAGLYARLDTVVLDDIADGVHQLIANGEVDPKRIAVIGGSFGGWATYMSLIKYPELYRAGVAIAAVAHWRKTLRDDRDQFGNLPAYRFWKALLDREDFAEVEPFIDPYRRARELKQPILLIHGELDNIVHATEARLMLDELKKHNPHVESRSFTNATHSYWPFATRVTRLNEIETFLRRHLASSETGASN